MADKSSTETGLGQATGQETIVSADLKENENEKETWGKMGKRYKDNTITFLTDQRDASHWGIRKSRKRKKKQTKKEKETALENAAVDEWNTHYSENHAQKEWGDPEKKTEGDKFKKKWKKEQRELDKNKEKTDADNKYNTGVQGYTNAGSKWPKSRYAIKRARDKVSGLSEYIPGYREKNIQEQMMAELWSPYSIIIVLLNTILCFTNVISLIMIPKSKTIGSQDKKTKDYHLFVTVHLALYALLCGFLALAAMWNTTYPFRLAAIVMLFIYALPGLIIQLMVYLKYNNLDHRDLINFNIPPLILGGTATTAAVILSTYGYWSHFGGKEIYGRAKEKYNTWRNTERQLLS